MSRVKVARKSTSIDMTAMCDVAFLLLTFFILSAKPRVPDPVRAVVPASTAIMQIPETDFAIITVGEGKAFFTIEGDDLRRAAIETMSTEYKVPFTKEQVSKFARLENFGVPLNVLGQYLDLSSADQGKYKQPGIPVDTNKVNDLANWVLQTRKADAALHNVQLRVAIKADAQQDYPVIDQIIKTLQKQHLDKFSLITSAKTVSK
jgi:biopolymer transport protein ExbD